MNVSNIQKVEHNRFARADLEYRLLMVDDSVKESRDQPINGTLN